MTSHTLPWRPRAKVIALILGVMIAATTAGCGHSKREVFGRASTTTTRPVGSVRFSPSAVVLRVETGGGFVPIESQLGGVASLTVYGDGRVITPDPRGPHQPGDLIRFRVGHIDQRVIAEIVTRFRRSGLFTGSEVDFGDPRVTDIPTTSVRLHGEGIKIIQVDAYGLRPEFNQRVDGAARHRRDVLMWLLAWASEATATEAPNPYAPQRLLVCEVSADTVSAARHTPVAAWPGPDLGQLFAQDPHRLSWTCAMVEGPDVGPIVAAAEHRPSGTAWRWKGKVHLLVLRTLLPEEPGCKRR